MEAMVRTVDDGIVVSVSVVPGARRAGIIGEHGDRLKVRVTAPPEKGKANAAVVKLLVDATGALSGDVVAGHTHRLKSVFLRGVDPDAVERMLDAR